MRVYIETGGGAYRDDAAVAWTFDLPHWGLAGQGHDEASALAALEVATGEPMDTFTIAERIHGNELAFDRDRAPARPDELALTRCLLAAARTETIRLVASATAAELDWDDPGRRLPAWAHWRTARQLAWHVADVESRYYLAALGVPPPPRADDLLAELRGSAANVQATLGELAPDRSGGPIRGEWTTVKVLRRLAWHEPGELVVLRRLLARARCALRGPGGER